MFILSVTISLLLISTSLASEVVLANQQKGSFVEIGNKTYYIDQNLVTKEEAIAKCLSVEMDLVSFEDVDEYKNVTAWILEQLLERDSFWTTGERAAGSELWTWGPGGPSISYSSEWVDGRPALEFSQKACICFNLAIGGWYDDPCEQEDYPSGMICERRE